MSAGAYHSFAMDAEGSVWAWGTNSYGQLGDGTITSRRTPVQLTGLSGVTSVASCAAVSVEVFSVALTSGDGIPWAWGTNTDGQLGHGGPPLYAATPVRSLL
ncbi:RCC1 domain-containing protein [Stigmatella hybrida]|uniref:hypothetical protein n=1 Tax=Stigmatella hybrida TaxID=394097 RepID=UPI00295E6904|nr:hypothetical protein [Stigmatella hybrida]